MNCLREIFLVLLCTISSLVFAQAPSDLSSVKASQITDTQLQQYISQAKANGLTVEQLENELLRRGLPQGELAELKVRIEQMTGTATTHENTDATTDTKTETTKRTTPKIKTLGVESPQALKKRSETWEGIVPGNDTKSGGPSPL